MNYTKKYVSLFNASKFRIWFVWVFLLHFKNYINPQTEIYWNQKKNMVCAGKHTEEYMKNVQLGKLLSDPQTHI